MLRRLLSDDLPRNRWLALLLLAIFLALALTPFIFPGTRALNVAAKVIVFIVLVASFDLLLGYTGIVSFAHTMFFGIGAYGVAIAATRIGPTWPSLGLGIACALAVSLVLSLLIGLFSLRVRAIFFAMITLAVASAFATLASQLADLTGGEDGLTFKVPEALQPGTEYAVEPFLGASIDGRFLTYYLIFFAALLLVLALLRIVNSPFGRVLQAIRDAESRVMFTGYDPLRYKLAIWVISAVMCGIAGALFVPQVGIINPGEMSPAASIEIAVWAAVGGRGTLIGPIVGAFFVNGAKSWFTQAFPEFWLYVLGAMFIAVTLFLPVAGAAPRPAPGPPAGRVEDDVAGLRGRVGNGQQP